VQPHPAAASAEYKFTIESEASREASKPIDRMLAEAACFLRFRAKHLEAKYAFQPSEGLHSFDCEECADEHYQQRAGAMDDETKIRPEVINMRSYKRGDESGGNCQSQGPHQCPLEGLSISSHGPFRAIEAAIRRGHLARAPVRISPNPHSDKVPPIQSSDVQLLPSASDADRGA
jgi:hypothetical protein